MLGLCGGACLIPSVDGLKILSEFQLSTQEDLGHFPTQNTPVFLLLYNINNKHKWRQNPCSRLTELSSSLSKQILETKLVTGLKAQATNRKLHCFPSALCRHPECPLLK